MCQAYIAGVWTGCKDHLTLPSGCTWSSMSSSQLGYQDYTALVVASKNGYLDVVNVMVAAGADVNTALTVAAQGAFLDVVKALVAAGANVNPKSEVCQ